MRLLNAHVYGTINSDMFYLNSSWEILDLAAGNFCLGQGAIIRANGAYQPSVDYWLLSWYPIIKSRIRKPFEG